MKSEKWHKFAIYKQKGKNYGKNSLLSLQHLFIMLADGLNSIIFLLNEKLENFSDYRKTDIEILPIR